MSLNDTVDPLISFEPMPVDSEEQREFLADIVEKLKAYHKSLENRERELDLAQQMIIEKQREMGLTPLHSPTSSSGEKR